MAYNMSRCLPILFRVRIISDTNRLVPIFTNRKYIVADNYVKHLADHVNVGGIMSNMTHCMDVSRLITRWTNSWLHQQRLWLTYGRDMSKVLLTALLVSLLSRSLRCVTKLESTRTSGETTVVIHTCANAQLVYQFCAMVVW